VLLAIDAIDVIDGASFKSCYNSALPAWMVQV